MKETFINSKDDMQWLRDGHLKRAQNCETSHFKAAILYGNEDSPEMIDLYLESEPVVCDLPFRLMWDEESEKFVPNVYYTKATAVARLSEPLDFEPDAQPGADEIFGDSN